MSSRLNVLSVGSSPNLLYYSWLLNNTGKFKFHLLNEEINPSIQIVIQDDEGANVFKPDLIYGDFSDLSLEIKFDLIFLSSKSLQDISNLSSNLAPFLKKTSIILIESSGFVNLEPFLKNCLPSATTISIFSILTTSDIRKLDQNQYLILTSTKPEIIIGESNTNNTKYQSTTLTNLTTISKIFQSSTNKIKIIIKNTYLEFLTEQWKLAIPQICFDPLLILFEEPIPKNLSNQILAKPLLSGLVTELITVAKTMGCRLPLGYDNESNFFQKWSDGYPVSESSSSNYKFLNSPKFFYNFYYKNNLNIDMLLLQPILLADDYGIKTPYLEFLYATICQFDKFNHSDISNDKLIFFKSANDNQLNQALESNELLSRQLNSKDDELNQLTTSFNELNIQSQKFTTKENQLLGNIESLKVQNQQLQQQLQQQVFKSKQLQQQHSAQQQALLQQQQQQQQFSQPPVQTPTGERSISGEEFNNQQEAIKHSIEGTPDLRDLTDAALISASMESPIKQNQPNDVNGDLPPPQQAPPQLSNGNVNGVGYENGKVNGLQPPHVVQQLSPRELELQKKEQLLYSREQELNKKLSQLNRYPQQNSLPPPQQPKFIPQNGGGINGGVHQPSPLYSVQNSSRNTVIPGPNGLQPLQTSNLTNGLPNGLPNGLSNQLPQNQNYHPQPRRISTMPTLESNEMFSNPQFKKTSRKNRKSSFPLVTPGFDDNYGMMPNSLNGRARPSQQQQPFQQQRPQIPQQGQMQSQGQIPQQIPQPYKPTPVKTFNSSPTIPTTNQIPQQQQQQPQPPQQPIENPYSNSNSNSNSSNELNHLGNNSQNYVEEAKPLGIVGASKEIKEEKEKKKKKGLFRKK